MLILLTQMLMSLICPKCGGYSWLKEETDTVIQMCVCGLNKFIYMKSGDKTLTRVPVKASTVVLPAVGSQLSQILGCMITLGDLTSQQIAVQLSITVDKATTNLSVLRSRGLIHTLEDRKGRLGGSLWEVYPVVKKKWNRGK
jgi:transcription initiation factor IIE alpha subunit